MSCCLCFATVSFDGGSHAELHWIPVGAGTRFQRRSLLLYEWVAARLSHRRALTLVHAGVTGALGGQPFTLELMPAPGGPNLRGEVTGPVGAKWAGRLRLFRYQVCLLEKAELPDQRWAVSPPLLLTDDSATVTKIQEFSRRVPAYTWGRRRRGHPEMWTSDSALSWILAMAGVEDQSIAPPPESRAPGWYAGIAEAALFSRR